MTLDNFLEKIKSNPAEVEFSDTIAVIDDTYTFAPTSFSNGPLENQAGENSGSCKIFAFAQRRSLSEQQTLHCFGSYYRDDVLKNPDGDNHQNIRNFMKTGWSGIEFNSEPLVESQ